MSALLELAERCEQATGLDKVALVELEADIRNAVEANPDHPFTISLDAAMTLVPVGWNWGVGLDFVDGYKGGSGEASVWPQTQPFPVEHDITIEAATPALALCAAALKALGATRQGDAHD